MTTTKALRKFVGGSKSAKVAGVPLATLKKLEKEGFLVQADSVETGKRGRPAFQYKLTRKGQRQVKAISSVKQHESKVAA